MLYAETTLVMKGKTTDEQHPPTLGQIVVIKTKWIVNMVAPIGLYNPHIYNLGLSILTTRPSRCLHIDVLPMGKPIINTLTSPLGKQIISKMIIHV